MGIFGNKIHDNDLTLVFDIGSSSVGGALFYKNKNQVPKIIFSIREPITLEENIDANRFLTLTLKSLAFVADKVYKAGLGAPSSIFCILSSPLYMSQTRLIKLEKNTPFIFNAKLANSLIQKEISLFEEEYVSKYKDTDNSVRPIEFKNIKTMLNGYETTNPLKQKITSLEMTIFISISPEYVLKQIEDTIKNHFNLKNIKFFSFMLSSFSVVRDMYINQNDFLLIDIGGEVTDISMVKKNALCESISFPLGLNFMIRGMANALDCSLAVAKSYISLIKEGHGSDDTVAKILPVINKIKGEWLMKFQKSLSNISSDISIPSVIYLATDKELSPFLCDTIVNEQFNQYTLTDSKFKVVFLGPEVFHTMVSFEENTIRDANLIMSSIYINRFIK